MTQQEIEELKSVLEYDLKACDDPETVGSIRIELAALNRLAKLEEAVAFKSFDEWFYKGNPADPAAAKEDDGSDGGIVIVELIDSDGLIDVIYHACGNKLINESDYTGWRYPIGDMTEK